MSAFYFYPITVFPVSLFAERWYSLCFVAKRSYRKSVWRSE